MQNNLAKMQKNEAKMYFNPLYLAYRKKEAPVNCERKR